MMEVLGIQNLDQLLHLLGEKVGNLSNRNVGILESTDRCSERKAQNGIREAIERVNK